MPWWAIERIKVCMVAAHRLRFNCSCNIQGSWEKLCFKCIQLFFFLGSYLILFQKTWLMCHNICTVGSITPAFQQALVRGDRGVTQFYKTNQENFRIKFQFSLGPNNLLILKYLKFIRTCAAEVFSFSFTWWWCVTVPITSVFWGCVFLPLYVHIETLD